MSKLSDSASLLNPSHTDSYTREQVHLLYSGLPLSLISSLIIGLLLSISHLPVIGQAEIIIWNLILGTTLIARLILWQFWLNAAPVYQSALWLLLFRIGACVGGAAWGAAPLLIYAGDNSIYQALLSFSLAGVVSGSLTSLSADRFSALGFALLAVCPLTVQIIVNDSPTALAMSVMTVLFIIFVISSSGRTQKELSAQIQQNEALLALSCELQKNREVDAVVTKVQSQFITDKNHIEAMQAIINNTIQVSGSEMGFIGEVLQDADKKPYIKMLVFSHKENKPEFNFFHEQHQRQEFNNLNGLFGSIIQTGKPVFCGNPRQDIRSIGTPQQHPEIHRFVGIPIFQGNQLLAVLCIANSIEEYTLNTVELLTPITNLISQFIHTFQLQKRHKQDIAALEETTIQTQTILDDIADGVVTIDKYGTIKSFNKAAETIFGYKAEQIIDSHVEKLMPESYRHEHSQYINEQIKTGKSNIIGIGREVIGLRRNGKHFPMDLMISRIVRDGQPMFIGIIRDISEKKLLQESHKHTLKNLAKDLRVPSHAISLALNMLDANIQSQKHTNSKSLIKSAITENQQLQKKIHSILADSIDAMNQHVSSSFKAIDIIENCTNRYKHIAELRGSRFSIVNRIYDENILINDNLFEQAMVYLLDLSAEYSSPFSEIKLFVEQHRGRIRIYSVGKLNSQESRIEESAEWIQCRNMLQQMHAGLGLDKVNKENSTSDNLIIYMEFPLAMIKAGL